MKRVLMIAYHFPPLAGSSGIQRTLRFARYLPEFGWEPLVLTAHPRAYPRRSDDQLADVPDGVPVIRAPAWDSARHLAVAGRYPALLARPDRWVSWWLGAVPAGLAAIRRYRPEAIWSTYPIATAHMIGHTLARRSGLPWIADFRDPMLQDDYPRDAGARSSFAALERKTVTRAALATFTTPGAVDSYRARYPGRSEQVVLLENGYDEEVFRGAAAHDAALHPDRKTLLHSGVVYPSERDPTHVFQALAHLKATAGELFSQLVIRFRAPVHERMLREYAVHYGVSDAVEVLPAIGYREAIGEMLCADGLLLLQADNCNAQVPAKLYEYMRARRPILALTDPQGDTAAVVRQAGMDSLAPLNDPGAIARLLVRFLREPERGTLPAEQAVQAASRRKRTLALAALLGRVSVARGRNGEAGS